MIFMCADTHFFHDNIRRLCNRPFDSIETMNQSLIDNINNSVDQNDQLWILGDVLWWKFNEKDYLANAKLVREGINCGTVNVVLGNHDKRPDLLEFAGFKCVQYHEIKMSKQHLVLFHYPILEWNGRYRGSIHLHGHSHGKVPFEKVVRRLDVGVDPQNYKPLSLDEIVNVFTSP